MEQLQVERPECKIRVKDIIKLHGQRSAFIILYNYPLLVRVRTVGAFLTYFSYLHNRSLNYPIKVANQ